MATKLIRLVNDRKKAAHEGQIGESHGAGRNGKERSIELRICAILQLCVSITAALPSRTVNQDTPHFQEFIGLQAMVFSACYAGLWYFNVYIAVMKVHDIENDERLKDMNFQIHDLEKQNSQLKEKVTDWLNWLILSFII